MPSERIFIGNLPSDTTNENLKRHINGFINVTSVEVKQKLSPDNQVLSTFAYANITSNNVQKDLSKLSGSKFGGHVIQVQLAKESFISRLQRENQERLANRAIPSMTVNNQETNKKPKMVNGVTEKNMMKNFELSSTIWGDSDSSDSAKNRSNDLSDDSGCVIVDSSMKLNGVVERYDRKGSNSDSSLSLQNEPILMPLKPNLSISERKRAESVNEKRKNFTLRKMAIHSSILKSKQVTYNKKLYFNDEDNTNQKVNGCIYQASDAEIDGSSKKKLPDDSGLDEDETCLNNNKKMDWEHVSLNKKLRFNGGDYNNQKVNGCVDQVSDAEIESDGSSKKKLSDDSGLDEDIKSLNIDKTKDWKQVSVNKKVGFNDGDNTNQKLNGCINQVSDAGIECDAASKKKLFDDSGSDEEEPSLNINKTKDWEMVRLQSQFPFDNRFKMDEKFFETEEATEEKKESDTVAEEINQNLNILNSVVGPAAMSKKRKSENSASMVRFDPSARVHGQFGILCSQDQKDVKNKKVKHKETSKSNNHENAKGNKQEENSVRPKDDTNGQKDESNTQVPSKEVFYKIDDKIVDLLQEKKENEFSLLKLFGDPEPKKVEKIKEPSYKTQEIKGAKMITEHFSTNWLEADDMAAATEVDKRCGLDDELFFYCDENDIWHKEALAFIDASDGEEDFESKRKELKLLVKHKVKRNVMRKSLLHKKIGGARAAKFRKK